MGEADAARAECGLALVEPLHLLADTHGGGGGGAGHPAVLPHPGDGRRVEVQLLVVAGVEAGGKIGEVHLQAVDGRAQQHQVCGERLIRACLRPRAVRGDDLVECDQRCRRRTESHAQMLANGRS
jgi:hypothetical protein